MDNNKKESLYTENDTTFYQKPYSENFPYNMVKMAAVEPPCFYPNREHVKEFNLRKLNSKKLTDYIYEGKENDDTEDTDIIEKLKKPYYLPEYYNSTLVNQMPLIELLPAQSIHETTKQYKQFEKLHYEEPEWTLAEKELFNLLYNTIGKNFHKMAKEFENKATTILIPPTLLKQSKVNITEEINENIMASITPLKSKMDNQEATDEELTNRKSKKRKLDLENVDKIQCQALPDSENKTIYLLVYNIKNNSNETIPREEMIFPRKTSEIIHYYYKNKFTTPNWKIHKETKIDLKKNKTK